MFVSRKNDPSDRGGISWLLIAAAASLAIAALLLASLTVGPASANKEMTPRQDAGSAIMAPGAGDPAGLPYTGGAQSNETAANMAFVLAAAALAVGTVVFVGSAPKGAPEAKKAESDDRQEDGEN